ncbi:MAG: hypothetical protein D3924_07680 [Candidatus Electrothrix sp. AR4]|nr:hypothetical protein [Candidatus Electrothrix sp. AR4]
MTSFYWLPEWRHRCWLMQVKGRIGLREICALALSGKLDGVHAESGEVLAESLVRNYLQGLQLEDVV